MLFLIWADEKYSTKKNPSVLLATQKNPGVFHRPKKILRTPLLLKYVSGAPGLITYRAGKNPGSTALGK